MMKKLNLPSRIYLTGALVYFTVFWMNALSIDANGNLMSYHSGIWADWMLHFSMGSAMAYRDLILTTHPILIGASFKYYFLANMIPAVIHKLGVPFFASFTITSYLFCLMLVGALYTLIRILFKSQNAAVLGSLIYFTNGGIGFIKFIQDVIHSETPLKTFCLPPIKYTAHGGWDLHWKSVLDTSVIPQRPFPLGMALSLLALALIYMAFNLNKEKLPRFKIPGISRLFKEDPTEYSLLISAALLLGLMPIIHAYSFLCCFIILGFWFMADGIKCHDTFLRKRLSKWITLAGLTSLIAVPLIFAFLIDQQGSLNKISLYLGWYAKDAGQNIFYFWLRNWGLVPYMALAGLWLFLKAKTKTAQWHTVFICLPFFFIFILSNIFIFQPWAWDNTKLFAWTSVGFSGLTAVVMIHLWNKSPWAKTAAICLFILTTASGGIDAYRLMIPKLNQSTMYTKEMLDLGKWAEEKTGNKTIWLTPNDMNMFSYNLAGRQPLMGYSGWLWSHGLDYSSVRKDVAIMYENPSRIDLFEKYNVDYAVINKSGGSQLKADVDGFDEFYPIIKQSENYTIYNIKAGKFFKAATSDKLFLNKIDKPAGTLKDNLLSTLYKNTRFEGQPEVVPPSFSPLSFWYNTDDQKPFKPPFSLQLEGFIEINVGGTYTFYTQSDDGSMLYIDDFLIVDNNGRHGVKEESGRVLLEKGWHQIKITYFDNGGGSILNIFWKKPQGQKENLSNAPLYHQDRLLRTP